MLRAHGHEVIPYTVSNDTINGMPRLELAARTLWSAPAYRELRTLFREAQPHLVHFHNTFPSHLPRRLLRRAQRGHPGRADAAQLSLVLLQCRFLHRR